MRTILICVLCSGCVTASGVPAAMHPTGYDTEKSVGVSLGGAYAKEDTTKVISLPYGEGAIHLPMTAGQLAIHVTPGVAFAGYRVDLSKRDTGVGFAIEPMIGGAYYNATTTSGGMESKSEAVALMLGIAPMISFTAGDGFVYLVPKLGYQYVKDLNPSMGQMTDSQKEYVVGLSLGVDLGGGISVELAIHRIDNADDRMPDPNAAWVVVPTVGVRH